MSDEPHVRSLDAADESSARLCPKCGHPLNPNLGICPACSQVAPVQSPLTRPRGLSVGMAAGIVITCFVLALAYLLLFGGFLDFIEYWKMLYR